MPCPPWFGQEVSPLSPRMANSSGSDFVRAASVLHGEAPEAFTARMRNV